MGLWQWFMRWLTNADDDERRARDRLLRQVAWTCNLCDATGVGWPATHACTPKASPERRTGDELWMDA